jgi:hypothetical protein
MNLRFTTLWTDQLADSKPPRATKTKTCRNLPNRRPPVQMSFGPTPMIFLNRPDSESELSFGPTLMIFLGMINLLITYRNGDRADEDVC